MSKKVYIFYSGKIREGVGGPAGYLFNLEKGLLKIREQRFVFLNPGRKSNNHWRFYKTLCLLSELLIFRKFKHKARQMIRVFEIRNLLITHRPEVLMFHGCSDFVWVKKIWERYLSDIPEPKWILMSHCPTRPSEELREALSYGDNIDDTVIEGVERDERIAFDAADVICSASLHAMDGYGKRLLAQINDKARIYIPSGCLALYPIFDSRVVREKFGIKTKYVVCYVGRHWITKGYVRLKELGKSVLEKHEDITFLIAGRVNPYIPPLKHPRWIELGWANPAAVYACSDAFVMPSVESYFDLVIPEAMSCGLKCFLSNVGGNIDFHKLCPEIEVFTSLTEGEQKLIQYLRMTKEEREAESLRIKKRFDDFFSVEPFAQRYVDAMFSSSTLRNRFRLG